MPVDLKALTSIESVEADSLDTSGFNFKKFIYGVGKEGRR